MRARHSALAAALVVLAVGCSDDIRMIGPDRPLAQTVGSGSIPVLQQSATAPALQTYQVSFWAYVGKETQVAVSYTPARGQSTGDPFLRFDVPRNALVAGAGGAPLNRGDSVRMTLTVAPTSFDVDFQPSGVVFSTQSPALLAFWYGHANLDLNGNGVLDGNDRNLVAQLAIWYQSSGSSSWFKQLSRNDTTHTLVGAPLYHFSEYAVSW